MLPGINGVPDRFRHFHLAGPLRSPDPVTAAASSVAMSGSSLVLTGT